jgi:hypothetical protein
MRPAIVFMLGAVLVWIVANGKAGAVWDAITGTTTTPGRPPDPSTNPIPPGSPYIPPRTG